MFKTIKNWFIPSESNDYTPRLLRAWPVALLLVVSITFFAGAQYLGTSLSKTNSYLAAVVASVLVDLTNFDRAQEGLHGLSVNATLQQAAQLKANDMAQKGYFSHNSPDGKTPWFWIGQAGYNFSYAGENLAVFFGDSEDVENAWMNSPAHRANILSSNFTEIGIATAEGYYQGRSTVFVVQMFGTPAVQRPVATLITEPQVETPTPGGEVSGESIQVITEDDVEVAPEVLLQDETFIAVKNTAPVPAEGEVKLQSTTWQRVIASPFSAMSHVYAVLGAILALGLIFLIVFEFRIQKPKNIAFGAFLLFVLIALSYFSFSEVVVAGVSAL